MNNSAGAAIAASSIATGLAIAEIQREEDEAKQRRIAYEGKDQVVFETPKDMDKIGEEIADIWSGTYYNSNEGSIYSKAKGKFGFGAAIGFAVLAWIILAIVWFCGAYYLDNYGGASYWEANEWFPIDLPMSIIVSIIVGIVFGFLNHPVDEEIRYIKFSSIDKGKNKTRILIKKYDYRGYRNIDEDDIMSIKEMM